MKVSYLLLISLLIVGTLCIPAVSADELINETYIDDVYFAYESQAQKTASSLKPLDMIFFSEPFPYRSVDYIQTNVLSTNATVDEYIATNRYSSNHINAELRGFSTNTLYGISTFGFFIYYSGGNPYVAYYLDDIEWVDIDVASDDMGVSGSAGMTEFKIITSDSFPTPKVYVAWENSANAGIFQQQLGGSTNPWLYFGSGPGTIRTEIQFVPSPYYVISTAHTKWSNTLIVDEITGYENRSYIYILKDQNPIGWYNASVVEVYSNTTYWTETGTDNLMYVISERDYPFSVNIKNIVANIWHNNTISPGSSVDPDDPDDQSLLRTGTVTMTDHNGTAITGFEVTAENFYTGQSYTFSTDTDVAVISLPMDRTIEIRNPQTGVYETAPIGYYRFFGQAPGYKMLNEDGIQVAVMPQKYGSYQLCDILVTPESGYLTGKHKFQIRSRSDNSILQTGTISAKSATTNQWYNTSVTDGIATLILPYDTSNPISQYAGNYYVYATSPGYEDSDYGTQIVVMPHTVSEIRDIYLTPIGGIPAAGNVTLRIQAFSEVGPGVPDAQIFIAGVIGEGVSVWNTYTASSTGYLAVSVPGNSTYDIVASAEGYYDSARRIEVFTEPPGLIEMKLYLSGAPTVEPTTQPTGWPTTQPTTQPTGIPDDDDGSESFLMQAVRGIGLAFGVGFSTAKLIFGMLLALSIGFATAKHLRGGAAEFGLGLVGGTMLGVLIGLLPVWTVVVLLLIVGLYIGNRYVGGANNG